MSTVDKLRGRSHASYIRTNVTRSGVVSALGMLTGAKMTEVRSGTHMASQDVCGRVAILVPCYNEEPTIATVVRQFRDCVPSARICVFNNDSSDQTTQRAREAGAEIFQVPERGKGNVVRRMFADIDADVYVLVDGDATYDAFSARRMIELVTALGFDMVVGARTEMEREAYRLGHRFGNRLLTRAVSFIFGGTFKDMLSGYRALSRRYVKSFPGHSSGFEIETELTVHALELRMPWTEINTPYGARPDGSNSKLSTYRDGLRILRTIIKLYEQERPLAFFTWIALFLTMFAWAFSVPVFITYFQIGQVPRIPSVVLATGVQILAVLSFVCGIILQTVTTGRKEAKHLAYLSVPSPAERHRAAASTGHQPNE